MTVQFRPLRSAVNPAFWSELAKKKLHEYRCFDTEPPCVLNIVYEEQVPRIVEL